MIKFFRKIRQKLITENKFSKYILYAIGEIILVMIGILLALQVNKWNESNRLSVAEIAYLKEIRTDIVNDTTSLSIVIRNFKGRLSNLLHQDSTIQFEPVHRIALGILPAPESKNDFNYFFRTERPFRPKQGTYKSLISEGKSSLITNRPLFNQLQTLYEDEYRSLERVSNLVTGRSFALGEKYAYVTKYEDFGSPVKIRNRQILADVNQSFDIHSLYTFRCVSVNNLLINLIGSLNSEIEKLERHY